MGSLSRETDASLKCHLGNSFLAIPLMIDFELYGAKSLSDSTASVWLAIV